MRKQIFIAAMIQVTTVRNGMSQTLQNIANNYKWLKGTICYLFIFFSPCKFQQTKENKTPFGIIVLQQHALIKTFGLFKNKHQTE